MLRSERQDDIPELTRLVARVAFPERVPPIYVRKSAIELMIAYIFACRQSRNFRLTSF